MQVRKRVLTGVALALLAAAALAVFTGVAYADDGDGLSQYLDVPNDDGYTPCAVFEARWGYQWLRAGDHPACDDYWPEVHVACFTAEETWTRETVQDFVFDAKPGDPYGMQFSYTITQDGVCGVFPNAPTVSMADAILFFALLSDSLVIGPPGPVSVADLPIFVYNVADPETAFTETEDLPVFIIATTNPNGIRWDRLGEGLYVVTHPADIDYGELPEHVFGGQTEFDTYPEGIYTLPDDPSLTEFSPLP